MAVKKTVVLVVDDEPFVRRALKRALAVKGFEPIVAASSKEARSAVESGPVDAALVDLRLANESGAELVNSLKRVRPEMQVVLMSGEHEALLAAKADGCAADHFGDKIEIGTSLEEVLGKRSLRTHTGEGEAIPHQSMETEHLLLMLERNGGNVSATARAMSRSRAWVHKKLAAMRDGDES